MQVKISGRKKRGRGGVGRLRRFSRFSCLPAVRFEFESNAIVYGSFHAFVLRREVVSVETKRFVVSNERIEAAIG